MKLTTDLSQKTYQQHSDSSEARC